MNQLGRLLRILYVWGGTSAQVKLNLYFVSLYALWTYDDRLHGGWLGLVKGAETGGRALKEWGASSVGSWGTLWLCDLVHVLHNLLQI